MPSGLPVSRLISVSVSLAASAATFANLGSCLMIGPSPVIDVKSRVRDYASLSAVAADFGTSAPEYQAAALFFAQSPQPTLLTIGRWAQAASSGELIGATLSASQQALANFTAITNGGIDLTVNGTAHALTGLNFSGAANLNAVAADLTTALAGAATVTWTGSAFVVTSATSGTPSTVLPATAGAGTDVSTLLGLTAAAGATEVDGVAAEGALGALQAIDALPNGYRYGVMFTPTTGEMADSDRLAIAAYVQASNPPHIYGFAIPASDDGAVLNPATSNDIASQMVAAGYTRTFAQYSSATPHAVASMFGLIATVDWEGTDTAPNLMWANEPSVTAETLSPSQAAALDIKRVNYFAAYQNGTAILESGVMFGPNYIDEVIGCDWLANYVQTNLFTLQVQAVQGGYKIPQTDAGVHLLQNNIESSMIQAVNNGFLAPGTWTAAGFGSLNTGDYMAKGYYIYVPSVATQAPTDRAARKSPPFQIAGKLAGAIDDVNVAITVNR